MGDKVIVRVTPFTGWGENAGTFTDSWERNFRSLDGTPIGEFREQDIDEVLYQGETGDTWDGDVVVVLRLKDGRYAAWETFYGPTGDGFFGDAYGGDAQIVFASDLRLLVNDALTDTGRRLAGVPEELWNVHKPGVS